MAKRDDARRRRHEKSQRRRADKARARKHASKPTPPHQDTPTASAAFIEASNPLSFTAAYQTGRTVFGEPMPAEFLVERIKTFDWKESFIRLAHLSAVLANDESGPLAQRALTLTSAGINSLTASTPDDRAMLERGRRYVAAAKAPLIVAHEEALVFLEHLVLLYGGDSGGGPADAELSLWLLGASDHLEAWQEEDARILDETERLAAELVKVYRFNRSSVDEVRLLSRAQGIFSTPPRHGPFADPQAWVDLQRHAFGDNFTHYFESFVVPLVMLSHSWGLDPDIRKAIPVVVPPQQFKQFKGEGQYFVDHLAEITGTREELRAEILKRMRPGALLPHAPTALLRKPFVDLQNGGEIVASSPWYVRLIGRTGIWARYLAGAKAQLGGRGGEEWLVAFGHMLEDWCRRYAKRAELAAQTDFRVEIPSQPGAEDEVEDVVAVEGTAVSMFSVKARVVREDIARHAISRTKLLDWYEQFFFTEKTAKHRAGVVAQLSARIDMVRAGTFEPRVMRNAIIYPVLVTFDNLCDNQMLSAWLITRCKAHGLLQQESVAPLTLAVVDDYERLLAAPFQKKSVTDILQSRSSRQLSNERLEVVLYGHEIEPRLPDADAEYEALTDRVLQRLREAADRETATTETDSRGSPSS